MSADIFYTQFLYIWQNYMAVLIAAMHFKQIHCKGNATEAWKMLTVFVCVNHLVTAVDLDQLSLAIPL